MSISNTDNPYFIIVAGPTASGKSTLVNKISHYLNNKELDDKTRNSDIALYELEDIYLKLVNLICISLT